MNNVIDLPPKPPRLDIFSFLSSFFFFYVFYFSIFLSFLINASFSRLIFPIQSFSGDFLSTVWQKKYFQLFWQSVSNVLNVKGFCLFWDLNQFICVITVNKWKARLGTGHCGEFWVSTGLKNHQCGEFWVRIVIVIVM